MRRSVSADLLGPDGPFGAALPGFRVRAGQRELAARIEAALAGAEVLVAESGTGTGKTLAYLVPVLVSGQRVVISTGTRHLQDQIFHRDLPLAMKALGVEVDAALLKGRTNYVCLQRAELDLAQQSLSVADPGPADELRAWLESSVDGDLAGAPPALKEPALRRRWTSTADDCPGPRCPRYSDCRVYRARRRAQEADLVIGNHHLFLSDLGLRDEGHPPLLPQYDAVIFDEAHQLVESGPQMLGDTVSSAMLRALCRDTLDAARRERPAAPLAEPVAALGLAVETLDGVFTGRSRLPAAWPPSDSRAQAVAAIEGALDELAAVLGQASAAGAGIESCWRRALTCRDRLAAIRRPPAAGRLHWYEAGDAGVAFRAVPVDLGDVFAPLAAQHGAALVFLSATLGVGDDFSFFCRSMGLSGAATVRFPSPFDYSRQALLYLPDGMPLPGDERFADAMVAAVTPVIEVFGGRTFILFTSHRMLAEVAARLERHTALPLRVQGRGARQELLRRFRDEGGVLLGTASFWEGVDVPGPALSCVIVDKLPFAPPDDPLQAARIEALAEAGLEPFREYQLPRAILTLKQGFGRLIRSESDRGLLMVCDPRIRSRSYGRAFLRALPDLPVTADLHAVRTFAAGGTVAGANRGSR